MFRIIKWFFILLFFGIIIYLVFAAVDYYKRLQADEGATFIKPRLKASSFKVHSYTKDRTLLDYYMVLDNPTPLGITVDSMTYVVFIGGEEVMRNTKTEETTLKALDSSRLKFPLTVNNRKLKKVLAHLKEKGLDTVEYRINFNFYTRVPFMKGKPVNYVYSKYSPLYMFPESKLQKVRILKAGLKDAKLMLTVKMVNPNVFAYRFQNSHYQFDLDDEEVARGTFEQLIVVPAEGEKTYEIPVELKTAKAVQKAAKAFLQPKKTSYRFYYECEVIGLSEQEDSRFAYEMADESLPVK